MTSYRHVFFPRVRVSVSRGVHPVYRKNAITCCAVGLRRLAQRRESEVHLMVDHVHLMLSIPPKYSVADRSHRFSASSRLLRVHGGMRATSAFYIPQAAQQYPRQDEKGPRGHLKRDPLNTAGNRVMIDEARHLVNAGR